MMTSNDPIQATQTLILAHQRRLQKLKEQRAREGDSADPKIELEIEDIEEELSGLKRKLAHLQVPVIYVRNFGVSDAPKDAKRLEWVTGFVSSPRSVPPADKWQDLPDRLNALKQDVGKTGLIRIEGQMALTTAFVLGSTFKDVGGYQLEIAQKNPASREIQYWHSDPQTTESVNLNVRHLPGTPQAHDAALIVYAAPKQTIDNILRQIEVCWGEYDTLSAGKPSRHLRAALSLEAQPALDGNFLTAAQAASFAGQCARYISDFVAKHQPSTLHLFSAVPVSLATLLGHRLNMLAPAIQCYEFVQSGDTPYAPTCRFYT